MTGEECFEAWAPVGASWSLWAKPVLFAHLSQLPYERPPDQIPNEPPDLFWIPEAGGRTAIVVDLPTAFFITAVEIEGTQVIGQFPAEAGGTTDEFGLLFDKDSPLVECANLALAALTESGELATIEQTWMSDNAGAPVISVG